jgi:hypothetical protein
MEALRAITAFDTEEGYTTTLLGGLHYTQTIRRRSILSFDARICGAGVNGAVVACGVDK